MERLRSLVNSFFTCSNPKLLSYVLDRVELSDGLYSSVLVGLNWTFMVRMNLNLI